MPSDPATTPTTRLDVATQRIEIACSGIDPPPALSRTSVAMSDRLDDELTADGGDAESVTDEPPDQSERRIPQPGGLRGL